MVDVINNRDENLPELGKYNAGQKLVFWSQTLLIPVLLVTGLVIWDWYFYGWTTIPVKRIAVIIHSLAAILAITVIIVHIYAGIWVKGTMRAMTRGTVTAGWAYRHHRKWFRQSLQGRPPDLRAAARRRGLSGQSARGGRWVENPEDIGEVSDPNFVRLPDPAVLFAARAARLRVLADGNALGGLSALPWRRSSPLSMKRRPRSPALPDADSGGAGYAPRRLHAAARPRPARKRAGRLRRDPRALAGRRGPLRRAGAGTGRPEAGAGDAPGGPHRARRGRYSWAHIRPSSWRTACLSRPPSRCLLAGHAAALPASRLKPVGDGVCPACGSAPVASMVVSWPGANRVRYCCCSLCQTMWNYVRIKCTSCGSTEKIAYYTAEDLPEDHRRRNVRRLPLLYQAPPQAPRS